MIPFGGSIHVHGHRIDSLLVIGPQQWILDHMRVIEQHGHSWMQYEARAGETHKLLERFLDVRPVDLFVYVPLHYRGGGMVNPPIPGSGLVECRAQVTEWQYRSDGERSRPPKTGQTVGGAQFYDINQDFRYPYWLRVERIEWRKHRIADFQVYNKTAKDMRSCTEADFAMHQRQRIVFAKQVR